jgi:hypothetical protein
MTIRMKKLLYNELAKAERSSNNNIMNFVWYVKGKWKKTSPASTAMPDAVSGVAAASASFFVSALLRCCQAQDYYVLVPANQFPIFS